MDAVLSGHAGVALLLKGDELSSIHFEDSGEALSRSAGEVHLLFAGAQDLEFLENVGLEEVRCQLDLASTRVDALHLALNLLDAELSHGTRGSAAKDLDDLLEDENVAIWVESVLFAHPLPRSADLVGACSACTRRTERTRSLLRKLESLQPVIVEVQQAWEGIPKRLFATDEDRKYALSVAVKEGLVRDLITTRAAGERVDDFLQKSLMNPTLRQIRDAPHILLEWVADFREPRKALPPVESDTNPIEVVARRTGLKLIARDVLAQPAAAGPGGRADVVSRNDPRHPIRVVSRRTGLKPDLIRAWERRYSVVAPGRSATRRRYYSDAEIERLALLGRVVRAGHTISQVAQLPNEELEELTARDALAQPAAVGPGGRTDAILACCLSAVQRLDSRDLGHQIRRASVELSAPALLDDVLAPLMQRIGDQWKQGGLRPFHEHMACAVVRSFLGSTVGEANHGAPVFLAATPPRQRHELGAMLATTSAAAEGWRVLYLGSDLPPEEIAAAALHQDARVVALSLVYPPDDALLRDELRRLSRLLAPRTELIVGGRASAAYSDVLQEIGALRLDDLRELRCRLEEIRPKPWSMPGSEAVASSASPAADNREEEALGRARDC